ncbi:hypothetical protein B0H10DRAFT_2441262 [Mycena sp. CBHHK59/15]|nr:hypothetical protein B0H10DRAFT_2441262 [Mycena sp. CBHHK59/15]
MHDWIPNTTSIGTPSYICIAVYRQFAGSLFSSVACKKLSCPTILQIPRTNILFSLASYRITRQSIPTQEGYPHTMATLSAVCELVVLLKDKGPSDTLGTEDVLDGEQEVQEDAGVGCL